MHPCWIKVLTSFKKMQINHNHNHRRCKSQIKHRMYVPTSTHALYPANMPVTLKSACEVQHTRNVQCHSKWKHSNSSNYTTVIHNTQYRNSCDVTIDNAYHIHDKVFPHTPVSFLKESFRCVCSQILLLMFIIYNKSWNYITIATRAIKLSIILNMHVMNYGKKAFLLKQLANIA